MERKEFDKEYSTRGSYHHHLTGFSAMWYKRNYQLLSEGTKGSVLDIACGDGRLTDFLNKEATLVDGFDLSPAAIALANKKHKYRNLWIGDILDENNYRRNTYDFFICSLSLQYLSNRDLIKHFEFMNKIVSKRKEYRFSFPNSKHVLAPGKLRINLEKYFSNVRMETIVGFVKNADSLAPEELNAAFLDTLDYPPEKSYHYIVTVSKR